MGRGGGVAAEVIGYIVHRWVGRGGVAAVGLIHHPPWHSTGGL